MVVAWSGDDLRAGSCNVWPGVEVIAKSTTPLYRAPEQLDLFLGYPIDERVDVWALGCLLYTLMFFKSPFNESEPLR